MHVEWLKQTVLLTLTDQFKQKWNSEMFDSSKGINYRIFKKELTLEKYFSILHVKYCKLFCKFRTMNHKLPIETGRWHNISRQNRICTLCNYEKTERNLETNSREGERERGRETSMDGQVGGQQKTLPETDQGGEICASTYAPRGAKRIGEVKVIMK